MSQTLQMPCSCSEQRIASGAADHACCHTAHTSLLAGALAVILVWGKLVYLKPKVEYNALHPYTSWIPITAFAVLRNLTPGLRLSALALYGWLGKVTASLAVQIWGCALALRQQQQQCSGQLAAGEMQPLLRLRGSDCWGAAACAADFCTLTCSSSVPACLQSRCL